MKKEILKLIQKNDITSQMVAKKFGVSRQQASRVLSSMVKNGQIKKHGSTRNSIYVSNKKSINEIHYQKKIANNNLQEHIVWQNLIEQQREFFWALPENIMSILEYSFSEMLNNAIDHSKSKSITITLSKNSKDIIFSIRDMGVGVFNNIQQHRKLNTPEEAIQDLLKGKTTTMPTAHSGEGIFFTSKIADQFELRSLYHQLTVHQTQPSIQKHIRKLRGTEITFQISLKSDKTISKLFRSFESKTGEYDFGRTKIQIQPYQQGGIFVSRSQAKRVLSGLEKFRVVEFDFAQVPMIGQGFADEIFRVFQLSHPDIRLTYQNTTESVEFMIKRAQKR